MTARRTFVGAVAAGMLAAWLRVGAQTTTTVRRIGVLSPGAPPPEADLEVERAVLRAVGWVEGQNLIVERRYTDGRTELLRSFAEEFVRLKLDLIVTWGTPATLAAKSATTTIPIVMASTGDPVLTGLVASLSRPGGNITGYSTAGSDLNPKRLELMRELLPRMQRVGLLERSTNPYYRAVRVGFEQACRSLALQPIIVEVASVGELENAIAELAHRQAQALVVQDDPLFFDNRIPMMSTALRYALPTIGARMDMLEAGALVSYGPGDAEQAQRYAAFVDRILRGAKPANLPIEQPTQFKLGINLKTARALRITVPQTLLNRADAVIQ